VWAFVTVGERWPALVADNPQVFVSALSILWIELRWLDLSTRLAPAGDKLTVANSVSALQVTVTLSDPLGRALLSTNGSTVELRSGVSSSPLPLQLGLNAWTVATSTLRTSAPLQILRLPLSEVASKRGPAARANRQRTRNLPADEMSNLTVRLNLAFPGTEAEMVRSAAEPSCGAAGRGRPVARPLARCAGRVCVGLRCGRRCR
jgi:hypothetical protein